jgi:hypothetical protein
MDTVLVITVFSLTVFILADFVLLLTCLPWLYWFASMSPEGYSSQLTSEKFFSARYSPLISPLLPRCLLFTVRALGIASRSPTKHCRSGGKSVRRGFTVKKFLHCALLNARSLQRNMSTIQHHIVLHNLDLAAITESWLREDSGDDILREVCPAGYSSLHKPRKDKRGGGVAIIFRDTIRVRPLELDYSAQSFEFIGVSLTINSTCFVLLVIYRPPSQKSTQFADEFASLLEFLVPLPGLLLIVGDFNIHVDDKSCDFGQSFLSLVDSFDLRQHVSNASHVGGHTLDLVMSRSTDNSIIDCFVSDFVSDHRAVHWCAKAHRPLRPVKKVVFRKLKSIDFSSFCSDLSALPLSQLVTVRVLYCSTTRA